MPAAWPHRDLLAEVLRAGKPTQTCLSSDEAGEPVGHQEGLPGFFAAMWPWTSVHSIRLAPKVAL